MCFSNIQISLNSTEAPQGTVLAPLLFTLDNSNFWYNYEPCHIQRVAENTAIMGCIKDDREEEYRNLVQDFTPGATQTICSSTPRKLKNWSETMRSPDHIISQFRLLESTRTLDCGWMTSRKGWEGSTQTTCGELCGWLLCSIVSFVDSLVTVAEKRTLSKLLTILDDTSHPLRSVISNQRSSFSDRLLLPKCNTNKQKNCCAGMQISSQGLNKVFKDTVVVFLHFSPVRPSLVQKILHECFCRKLLMAVSPRLSGPKSISPLLPLQKGQTQYKTTDCSLYIYKYIWYTRLKK